ncbi:MAG: glycosyltransferase family 39 protein [Elusimicrobia bacterium]|nr:glycosyltransferase family 39 protein [Elusimicrobiota bacterium]
MQRRDRLAGAGLFLGTLLLFVFSYRAYFSGGWTFEFCHYADIASNILSGRGFSTSTFWPCELAVLERAGAAVKETGPVVSRSPLFAYWSALWMALGRADFGMALGSGLAHAFWVIVIFVIGRRFFSYPAALLAAGLWLVHPMLTAGYDLSGHPDVLFGCLFGLLSFLYWQALESPEPPGFGRGFGLGCLAGAALLTRSSFAVWLPVFLAAPLLRRKTRLLLPFLTGFLALSAPWLIYSLRTFGAVSPPLLLWNLADKTLVPNLPWMEYRVYSLSDFMNADALAALLRKGWLFFNVFLKDLPTLWAMSVLFPFAAAGMIVLGGPASGFAAWLLILLAWQAVAFSFLRYEALGLFNGRYYLWFAPFVVLYAAAFFESRFKSKAWRIGAAAALALVLQSWVSIYAAIPRDSRHPSGLAIKDWPELKHIRGAVPSDAWIATNIPAQISWYAKRRTFNVTNRPQDLPRLLERWPAEYVFLSSHESGELQNYPAWLGLLNSAGGPENALEWMGFKLEKAFDAGVLYRKAPSSLKPGRP